MGSITTTHLKTRLFLLDCVVSELNHEPITA